jgi:hypothetical protein
MACIEAQVDDMHRYCRNWSDREVYMIRTLKKRISVSFSYVFKLKFLFELNIKHM